MSAGRKREPSVAVVGIGSTGFGRFTPGVRAEFGDDSRATLSSRAVSLALADAGLAREQIDGLVVQIGSPRGLDYDVLASLLNLNVRYASQSWAHGRWNATTFIHGALAVEHGLADYVLCIGNFKNSIFNVRNGAPRRSSFDEAVREGGGPHAENPHTGLAAPVGGAAMAFRRYLDVYKQDREKLAAVAVSQRKWAQLNPAAAMHDRPLTTEEYLASRYIVEPLRLYDCSYPVDMATAVILTTRERAADLEQTPVYLHNFQGIAAGPNEYVFGAPGLGMNQAEVFDYHPDEPILREVGLTPADVGAICIYDGFSTQVVYSLERFGFCAPGEGLDFIQHGRIEPGGELAVNPSGGHLSEGHSNGWGSVLEIVRQLRGTADGRQLADINFAMWATDSGDAVLYGK